VRLSRELPELVLATGEGLGNTFLIARNVELRALGIRPGQAAVRWCRDEWDGLLLIDEAGQQSEAQVYNRDGSAGGTCLNGLRILAKFQGGESGQFVMDGRFIDWRLDQEDVELSFAATDIPAGSLQPEAFQLNGRPAHFVDFWNPHCVIEVEQVEGEDLAAWASFAAADIRRFPAGVNTELVAGWGSAELRMRVFERGVGETQACGSGAVAAAYCAWSGGQTGPIQVQMPGGSLALEQAADGALRLRGPASVQLRERES